ncbi:Basal-body rod modification protein FlgD [Roseivivax jejudonensis]|uniref:Basal-body rod modification protein FlgD n=1 Tax=Roseivivax jejudonensis TaxID=1529041 RepID=A0A1X6YGS5_9RHOB|nr:flagellar hook capping FlgD N-terminal domain-containing protein [Roseivivax jejudonensis]SLN21073.1 Basal-body rod modification protein FlgD [Roseivivax jejudonensis]
MSDFSPVSARGQTAPIAQTAEENARRPGALTSDFDTFLRMLTVQAQNQDPLNPMDATDYATQLATFSSVEQQVVTNDLLTQIASAIGGPALEGLRSWIGAEVLTQAPARFDGAPVTIRPDIAAEATSARLVVTDASGSVVSRQALDPSAISATWPGTRADGTSLPSGVYGFAVESYAGETLIESGPPALFTRVTEASLDASNEVVLRLADGTEIREDAVYGVRVSP